MQSEDELALGDPAHVLDQLAVARPVGHLLVLVTREGMRAGGRDQRVALGGCVPQSQPQAAQVFHRLLHGVGDVRGHLDDRLE